MWKTSVKFAPSLLDCGNPGQLRGWRPGHSECLTPTFRMPSRTQCQLHLPGCRGTGQWRRVTVFASTLFFILLIVQFVFTLPRALSGYLRQYWQFWDLTTIYDDGRTVHRDKIRHFHESFTVVKFTLFLESRKNVCHSHISVCVTPPPPKEQQILHLSKSTCV